MADVNLYVTTYEVDLEVGLASQCPDIYQIWDTLSASEKQRFIDYINSEDNNSFPYDFPINFDGNTPEGSLFPYNFPINLN